MANERQQIAGVADSLTTRSNELVRSQAELRRLLGNLPSDYAATENGANYARILQMVAEEYARHRSLQNRLYDDIRWERADVEVLYQNLGHRLHDLDDRTAFFPDIAFDEDYRRFLIGVLHAVLRGSTAAGLVAGVAAATGLTATIQEFFRWLPPRQEPSLFDVSDRNYWKISVAPATTADFALIYRGLQFIGRLIKPAHTLFDVNLRLPATRRVGLRDGCYARLGVDGYLRATHIIKSRLRAADEAMDTGVVGGRRMRGLVTGTYQAGPMQVEVGGVTVQVTAMTVFADIDGEYASVAELQIGDVVEVQGFVVDTPITLDGFIPQDKRSDQAVCVGHRWRLEQYRYRTYRICRTDRVECRAVDNETVEWANFPTRQEFYLRQLPLADLADCAICYQTTTGGQTLVTVTHDDGVNPPVDLPVNFVDPYSGRVMLAVPAPAGGTTRVSYRYWHGTPVVGMQWDADGFTWDQDRDCGPFIAIWDVSPTTVEAAYNYSFGDGPNVEELLYLNGPQSLLNDEVVLAPGNVSGVQTLAVEVTCQQPWTQDEPSYVVHYTGFLHAHSTCWDTPNFAWDEGMNRPLRHRWDDYNVIDSRGFDLAVQEATLPEAAFAALVQDQVQRIGTILVPWTQDFVNGVNRVFQREVFVPGYGDLLNSAHAFLNQQGVVLNDAQTVRVREYLQDMYTALIAFTRFTSIDTENRCRLVPRARACRSVTYYFVGA